MHSTRFRRARGLGITLVAAVFALATGGALGARDTIRQWQFVADGANGFKLALREVAQPEAARGQVLVRVHAVALNRRDLLMRAGRYGLSATKDGGVPLSDGAGEVIAVGADVTRFKVGDRVAGTFFEHWIEGPRTAAALASARGGNGSGMLSEVIAADPEGIVAIPAHLSYEEAATLPCTGVTAWVALFKDGHVRANQFVLIEGTGGVSVIGLQLAAAAGARPIVTSSSDQKLERARKLGAAGTVNYKTHPDWQNEVRSLTHGAGVDQVLEVGGQDTLPKALQALAYDGHVAMIGGLSGFAADVPVGALMGLGATVSGIYVGSRADFEALNEFVTAHKIHPIVDKVFSLEDAPKAFDAMNEGEFFGKIVIRL